MDKLKCMACGYVEDDNFAVGNFVEIEGLTSDDVAKAVACPVCGTVKVIFNYDYYEPENYKK